MQEAYSMSPFKCRMSYVGLISAPCSRGAQEGGPNMFGGSQSCMAGLYWKGTVEGQQSCVHADGENGVSGQSAAQQLGMADIVDRMRDLAKNTGDASRRSKKDRASLRSTFKDLINVVEVRLTLSFLPLGCRRA